MSTKAKRKRKGHRTIALLEAAGYSYESPRTPRRRASDTTFIVRCGDQR
jgi:hypothetical protein